ncbi:MAG: rod shape-determining protein MreC [Rhodoferax sp.]|jgi:rod shape-determining protein MreC|nr:rod shape-determining protein MreC [Rhodoferax sp.]
MPLGTLDRTPPPLFRQGLSALSKLTLCSALALFLMVADIRYSFVRPLRAAIAEVLYPVQWLVLQPVDWVRGGSGYFQSLASAQASTEAMRVTLARQSIKAQEVDQLLLENERLRQLLALGQRVTSPSMAAQVLYDAADPFSRKIVIDRGKMHGVVAGSPVIDAFGVLGQVTRVYGPTSEVTLITDGDQAIPVLNTRTGVRGVAFGDLTAASGGMELRFTPSDTDVEVGDVLSTSGVDGVYPPGLAVARVNQVQRRSESVFARINLTPLAQVRGTTHVMVLQPVKSQIEARPDDAAAPVAQSSRR